MGNLKIELKPPSKWSASLFFYSSISCSISGKDEKATSTKNRVLSGFVHLKGKDKARLDSRQNLKQSFFLAHAYEFVSSLNKNIFSKPIYRHFSKFSKDLFSGIPLYGIRLMVNAETKQYLESDIWLFAADHKQSKGFISIVKIPDKSLS